MTELVEDNKLFSLSSDSAVVKLNGSQNSRLIFNIPNFIHLDNDIKQIFFSVNSAVIPASFYNINSSNNKIQIGTTVYSITEGNYNINDLITAINTVINTAILVSISYNSITNKTTIINNGGTAQVITLSTSTLLWLLGFERQYTITLSSLVSTTSPNCVNLLNIPRIFIRSNDINAGNYSDETESNDVLAVIPNTACVNGVIHYTNFNGVKHLVDLQNLSNFTVIITDDERRTLDFNGVPIYFTFNITTIKEVIRPPSFELQFQKALELQQYNSMRSLEREKYTPYY
jgi:hypothetical protein